MAILKMRSYYYNLFMINKLQIREKYIQNILSIKKYWYIMKKHKQ